MGSLWLNHITLRTQDFDDSSWIWPESLLAVVPESTMQGVTERCSEAAVMRVNMATLRTERHREHAIGGTPTAGMVNSGLTSSLTHGERENNFVLHC